MLKLIKKIKFTLPVKFFSKDVHQWSKLGKSFNLKPKESVLKNIGRSNVGLFNIPQLKDNTGFYLLKENVIQETENLVEEICSKDRRRKLVKVFDNLSDSLCRVADMADFVRVAHNDPSFRKSAEDVCMVVSSLVETLNTNQEIYKSLQNVVYNGDIFGSDEIDKRVADLFLFDFQLSGIHLDEIKRKKFVELNQNILLIGSLFMENCYKPSETPIEKVPEHLQNIFARNGRHLRVNGLHSDNSYSEVREAGYKLYLYPDEQQANRLNMLLEGRHKMSQLAGFETYAHRALKGTLLENPAHVLQFLEILNESIKPKSLNDLKILQDLKNKSGDSKPLEPWDVTYYANMYRKSKSKSNLFEISNYLSLGACMEGLNNLFQCLFDVTMEVVETDPGEVWARDIIKLQVSHSSEGVLGHIYCDFFERHSKPNQDCHFTIQGGRLKDDGSYQKPIVVLLLNLNQPSNTTPCLLSPMALENLFHEFGHAMHSMLGRTRYQHVTGTRCSTDFAEVPSILMEQFALDPRVLKSFARHWRNGDLIPDDLAAQFSINKKLFSASETHLQVFYSLVDQVFHSDQLQHKPVTETIVELHKKYFYHDAIPDTAWYLRFGHFVGYGAKYYSYLVSKAIASQIWSSYFKEDPFNKANGTKLRECLLKHGGEVPPDLLVENMLGEKLSFEHLSTSILNEIDK